MEEAQRYGEEMGRRFAAEFEREQARRAALSPVRRWWEDNGTTVAIWAVMLGMPTAAWYWFIRTAALDWWEKALLWLAAVIAFFVLGACIEAGYRTFFKGENVWSDSWSDREPPGGA